MENKIFLLFFVLGVSLTSCYEREEACLDTFATNFAIMADDPCDLCCTYPEVKFQISHQLGDVRFSRDSVSVLNNGDSIRIDRAIILLSNIKLATVEGPVLEVGETSLYRDTDGKETEQKEDNVVILDNSSFATIGEIRDLGTIDSVSLNIGVANNGVALEDDSKLSNYDTLYVNDAYYDVVLYVSMGTLLEQDIKLSFTIETDTNNIGFNVENVVKELRQDVGLQLIIDYEKLFKPLDIDLTIDNQIINLPYPEGFLTIKI